MEKVFTTDESFVEHDETTVAPDQETAPVSDQEPPEPEKKYSDADLDRIIKRRLNQERRRVEKALMNDPRERDLAERERAVQTRELKASARELLRKDGLPDTVAELLDYDSGPDGFNASYDAVGRSFSEAVGMGVKNALRGSTPKTGSTYHDPIADIFRSTSRR